jgi:hypothetical protein
MLQRFFIRSTPHYRRGNEWSGHLGILLDAATFAASGITDTGGVQAKTHSGGGLRARLGFRNAMGTSGLSQSPEQRVCRKSSRCMRSL